MGFLRPYSYYDDDDDGDDDGFLFYELKLVVNINTTSNTLVITSTISYDHSLLLVVTL